MPKSVSKKVVSTQVSLELNPLNATMRSAMRSGLLAKSLRKTAPLMVASAAVVGSAVWAPESPLLSYSLGEVSKFFVGHANAAALDQYVNSTTIVGNSTKTITSSNVAGTNTNSTVPSNTAPLAGDLTITNVSTSDTALASNITFISPGAAETTNTWGDVTLQSLNNYTTNYVLRGGEFNSVDVFVANKTSSVYVNDNVLNGFVANGQNANGALEIENSATISNGNVTRFDGEDSYTEYRNHAIEIKGDGLLNSVSITNKGLLKIDKESVQGSGVYASAVGRVFIDNQEGKSILGDFAGIQLRDIGNVTGVSNTLPTVNITNSGVISGDVGVFIRNVFQTSDSAGDVRIENTANGTILGTRGVGVSIVGVRDGVEITNRGEIIGSGISSLFSDEDRPEYLGSQSRFVGAGIAIHDGFDNESFNIGADEIKITNSGSITGSRAANSGQEGFYGVFADAARGIVINSSGTITGDGAPAIYATNSGGISSAFSNIEVTIGDLYGGSVQDAAWQAAGNLSARQSALTQAFPTVHIDSVAAASVIIESGGALRGSVDISGTNVSITNNGTWSVAGNPFRVSRLTLSSDGEDILDGSTMLDGEGEDTFLDSSGKYLDYREARTALENGDSVFAYYESDKLGFLGVNSSEAGSVIIRNSGRLEVLGDTTLKGMTQFFNDKGIIDLTKDSESSASPNYSTLTLDFQTTPEASTFYGSATVNITSTVIVNANLSGTSSSSALNSDRLVIRNTSAQDRTLIEIVDSNPSLPGVNDPEGKIVVVVDDSASPQTAFALKGGAINKGLWEYRLYQRTENDAIYSVIGSSAYYSEMDSGADAVWRIASAPSQHAHELPVLQSAAQEAWHQSSAAWLDHTNNVRMRLDGGNAVKGGAWARIVGADIERKNVNRYTQPVYNQVISQQNDYNQDIYGVMFGADGAIDTANGGTWLLGLTGGVVQSKVDFTTSTTRMDYTAGSIGAYASFVRGGGFFNALLKGDMGSTDYKMSNGTGISANESFNTTAVGLMLDGGYRFRSGIAFLEPSISVAAVNTDVKDKEFLATRVNFSTGNSLRTKLTLATGFSAAWGGTRWEPFLALSAVNEADGENDVQLTSGGENTPVKLQDRQVETYGQVALGLKVVGSKGSSGFLKVEHAPSKSDNDAAQSDAKRESTTVSAGVKLTW